MNNRTHDDIQKALGEMSQDDLKKELLADPMYQAVIKAVPEKDRARIEEIAMDFMDGWKSGVTDKIIEMASNPEFVKAFMKAMIDDDDDASGLGELL